MNAFELAIQKAIDASIRSAVKGYITEFAERLTEQVNADKKINATKIMDLWTKLTEDENVKIGARKKTEEVTDPSLPSCEHMITKGDRKDRKCCGKISKNSKTQKYCSKHYKQNEKSEDGDKTDCCTYILKRGDHEGEECGKRTTNGSEICSKHKGDKKKKETKTTEKSETSEKKTDAKKGDAPRPKITAKPIKTGDLKGMCYFEHDGVKFVFETKSKIVKGTMDDNDKLVKLTSGQVKTIKGLPPFQVEEKKEEDEELTSELSGETFDPYL